MGKAEDFFDRGLTHAQAQQRLAQYGANVTQGKPKKSLARRFFAQFGDLMIVILLVAAALSFGMALYSGDRAELLEPVIILAIVLCNAVLGTVQEYRAERSLEALQRLTSPKTKVVRSGAVTVLDSAQLTVGDVALFEAGDVVTADCKLLWAEGLFVNQSALTGESVPLEKHASPSIMRQGDVNKIFSGSLVTGGKCCAEVYAVGKSTELGKIADMLSDSHAALTPLQQRLKQLSKVIGAVCLAVCLLVLVIGFVKGVKNMSGDSTLAGVFVEVLLTSVSLAVAAIPEGLPAVVTVVLAKGIERLASKNAVVKRLTAVEALGSATVICSDKTGTLTQNKMSLAGVFDGHHYIAAQGLSGEEHALQAFCWCSDAVQNDNGQWLGDPTEIAVTSLCKAAPAERLFEIPFDSARKLMTVVVRTSGRYFAITKGSPDAMKSAPNYAQFASANKLYAKRGLRVLALSVREVGHNFPRSLALESDLHIEALFTVVDPPRPEAKHAVATCKSAGIRPVMITGDNLDTAKEIASQLGLLSAADQAVDGDMLAAMTDAELAQMVSSIAVYARVTPADKLRIVNAWQQCGAVVAMTGDGVNDAPALKAADIGCAMGSGTEVAKDAADIILTDDNFATVVDAVSLGRSVYENIKKSVMYLLTCNIGEVLSVFVALLVWNVSPLSAMQLLWINLVTDGLPGLALGIYKQDADVMSRPPKGSDETFFSGGGGRRVALGGVLFALATLIGYAVGNVYGASQASTMAYLVLSVSQLVYVLEMRNNRGLFRGGITPFMSVSLLLSFAMVCLVAFVPALRDVFGLSLLPGHCYLAAMGLSLVPTVMHGLSRLVRHGALRKRRSAVAQRTA